eukprot:754044-Hanusia_phi.AAC.1
MESRVVERGGGAGGEGGGDKNGFMWSRRSNAETNGSSKQQVARDNNSVKVSVTGSNSNCNALAFAPIKQVCSKLSAEVGIMDPSTLLTTSSPPFAVADSTPQDESYLPISRSPQLADNKRVFTSTRRFRVHNESESARSLRSHDIPGAQASSTRNLLVTKRFGNDKKSIVGIYDAQTQQEVEAFSSLYHKASNTGLLGDAVLGSYLPHRSQSYKLKNKNVKYSLQTEGRHLDGWLGSWRARPDTSTRSLPTTSTQASSLQSLCSPRWCHADDKR